MIVTCLLCKIVAASIIGIGLMARDYPAQPDQGFRAGQSLMDTRTPDVSQDVQMLIAADPKEFASLDVSELLTRWQVATSRIERMDCTFKLSQIDHVFEVESVSTGRCAFHSADSGVVWTEPSRHRRNQVSVRRGKAYSLQPGQALKSLFEDDLITLIDLERDEAVTSTLPVENQLPGSWVDGLLIFNELLFGMKVEEATRRFDWSATQRDGAVILKGVPRNGRWRSELASDDEAIDDNRTRVNWIWPGFTWLPPGEFPSETFCRDVAVCLNQETFLPTHIRVRYFRDQEAIWTINSLNAQNRAPK